jgi:hypothetical protein
MKTSIYTGSLALVLAGLGVQNAVAAVSLTPPMGWASYDCLNYTATEADMKAMADSVARKYAPYGWEYVNTDWGWYYPDNGTNNGSPNQNFSGNTPSADTRLNMDAYGRLQPDTVRYPSSRGGMGFKPLADYIHGKGLKFGIHIMRGIPRQAVGAKTSIYGTNYTATDAADQNSTCSWLNDMYGLNMNNAAGQAYIKSIIDMYAAWGVDYIKIDDMMNASANPRTPYYTQIQAYRAAMDSSHHDFVFSTSPGATPVGDSTFIRTYANQWRMADDLWDDWNSLNNMIGLCAKWYGSAASPHFPDADMIPIGYLSERGPVGDARYSNLSFTEQTTMMTMWSIARSPLIWGGDLRKNRASEDSLMMNAEVMAVNQHGQHPRPLAQSSGSVVWASDHPDSANVKYVALVNLSGGTSNVSLSLASFSFNSAVSVRDLWGHKNLGAFTTTFTQSLPSHGSGMYKVTLPIPNAIQPSSPRTNAGAEVLHVVGTRLAIPDRFAGKTLSIRVYTLDGRMVNSLVSKDETWVSLDKGVELAGSSLYLVRIDPALER